MLHHDIYLEPRPSLTTSPPISIIRLGRAVNFLEKSVDNGIAISSVFHGICDEVNLIVLLLPSFVRCSPLMQISRPTYCTYLIILIFSFHIRYRAYGCDESVVTM